MDRNVSGSECSYPDITIDGKEVLFDRILADVPCSGDGRELPAAAAAGHLCVCVCVCVQACHLFV
jgi:hypothetical protein